MILLFANTKGGVGKTTLATHFTVYLHDQGNRVALLDCDKQASAFGWVSEAEEAIRACHITDPDLAVEKLLELREQYEYVVLDSSGDNSEMSRTLMLLCQLVVFPVGPSILDVRSLADASRTLKYAQGINGGRPEGRIVCNRIQRRRVISRELPNAIKELGVTVANQQVRELVAFRDAAQQATVVTRMNRCQARLDVEGLFRELLEPRIRLVSNY